MEDIKILAIESSCDETAAAVVKNGREVLSNIITSQIDLHTLYGGVVPEIASRKHLSLTSQLPCHSGTYLYFYTLGKVLSLIPSDTPFKSIS